MSLTVNTIGGPEDYIGLHNTMFLKVEDVRCWGKDCAPSKAKSQMDESMLPQNVTSLGLTLVGTAVRCS